MRHIPALCHKRVMTLTKKDVVSNVLRGRTSMPRAEAKAFAPANIALCKYWGKRNEELNLPVTSSLSLSLGPLGSEVVLAICEGSDRVELNGEAIPERAPFAARLFEFLDLFRPTPATHFNVIARNTIPTAAGFASSASGFAALVTALNDLFGWGLDKRACSILARLGSGSASRSVYEGFVEWHAGSREDGMDSYAEPLDARWPELCMGLLTISSETKKTGSRPGMKHTIETSPLYAAWPAKATRDLAELKSAIAARDFERLGRTAESNALAMHATMIAAWPTLLYWLPESVRVMQRIVAMREDGVPLFFTMDAGPNIKLLFLDQSEAKVREAFPDVQVVAPFTS